MKVFFVIVGACLLGAFTCWKSVVPDATDDLFLKNVEALADEEFWAPPGTYCGGSGNYTCPGTGVRVGAVYEGFSLRSDEETY